MTTKDLDKVAYTYDVPVYYPAESPSVPGLLQGGIIMKNKKGILAAMLCIIVIAFSGCKSGLELIGDYLEQFEWTAIRLSKSYKIDTRDYYQTENISERPSEYVHDTTYLVKQTGVYGEDKAPSHLVIARLYIWTEYEDYVYMLGDDDTEPFNYFRLDVEADQLYYSTDLNDFDQNEQEIFMKLEAHPELFTDIQEMGPDNPPYSLNGKGKVKLKDLE